MSEADVGHARRALRGRAAREDEVLGPARPERAALLAERPAQRVREVALAAAVGPDDRRDARPELTRVRSANDLKPDQRGARAAAARLTPATRRSTGELRRRRPSSATSGRPRRLGLAAAATLRPTPSDDAVEADLDDEAGGRGPARRR